jgi:hypothetical protein
MNKKDINWCWISALTGLDSASSPVISHKEHDYKSIKFLVCNKCSYLTYTLSDGTIGNEYIPKILMSMMEDENGNYEFISQELSQLVMGSVSAERTVDRAIKSFFNNFGYMNIEVQVIRQIFKSSGDVKISVIVTDAKLFR